MTTRSKFTRRDVILGTGIALASEVIIGCLGRMADLFPDAAGLRGLSRAVAMGQTTAFAQATAAPMTLVSLGFIDKIQAAMLFHYFAPGDTGLPNGIDGMGGLAFEASAFRAMNFTKLFGDQLDIPEKYGFAVYHDINSGAGGHSLAGVRLNMEVGSIHNAYEKWAIANGLASPLGPIGFGVRSAANDSAEMFVADQGRPMQTYSSVSSLLSAVSALKLPSKEGQDLLVKLDRLAGADRTLRDRFFELGARVDQVVKELAAAAADPSYVMQQAMAISALARAGLCNNAMMTAVWADTNGGGDLNARGGSKQRSPLESIPEIARAVSYMANHIDNLHLVSWSDGSRSANNGDASGRTPLIVLAPSSKLKTGVFAGMSGSSTSEILSQLGNNGEAARTHGNLFASVLKMMGAETHGVAAIDDILLG